MLGVKQTKTKNSYQQGDPADSKIYYLGDDSNVILSCHFETAEQHVHVWSQHSVYGQILSSGKEFWNRPANFVKQSVFHPTRNIMNAWHLLLSVSASPHCSHQYRTIPFVIPYLSGLKSDLFLVY